MLHIHTESDLLLIILSISDSTSVLKKMQQELLSCCLIIAKKNILMFGKREGSAFKLWLKAIDDILHLDENKISFED